MLAAPSTPLARSGWLTCAAFLAGLGALAYIWMSWCAFPGPTWNELRLAPAFALRHGVPLYPPVAGGPLSTWIYGPMGAIINLPATFAGSAENALKIAGLINLLTLVLPLAWICHRATGVSARGRAVPPLALALLILALPSGSLVFQVADHTAIALGLLSTWLLAQRPAPGTGRTALAAALCVLSICSKQTSLFLAVAHVIGLLAFRERAAALRYAVFLAAFGLLALAAAGFYFGFGNLWLNLVEIPARLPWGDIGEKISRRWVPLLAYTVLPPVCALWLLRPSRPTGDPAAERLLRLGFIAFLTLLPVCLLGFCKIGGDTNTLHGWYFLLPPLALVSLSRPLPNSAAWLAPLLAAIALCAVRSFDLQKLPVRPATARIRSAEMLAHAEPGTRWFPHDPVVTYYSDHRLYHAEDGIATRNLAGLGLREKDFRAHLPPRLAAIVCAAEQPQPFALQLLPDFNVRSAEGDWIVFTRPPAP